MVVEYIRYTVPSAQCGDFEDAYRRACEVLTADPHCLGYEVARGVEEPEHFVVRIEWDSVEGHEQGFRSSPRLVSSSRRCGRFSQIEEMKHYDVRAVDAPR